MNSNLKDSLLVLFFGITTTILAAGFIVACPSPNGGPVTPPPDVFEASPPIPLPEAAVYEGSTTSDCFKACEALRVAGCKEGSGTCITRLQTIQDLHTEQNLLNQKRPLTCKDVEGVRTPQDFRAMGQVCTVGP